MPLCLASGVAMSDPTTWRKDPDPGPPTWIEAAEGFARLVREAGEMVRDTADILRDHAEPYLPNQEPSSERRAAHSVYSAADATWKHWNRYARCYEAFIRLHPDHAHVPIAVECKHKGACRVSDDDGFYRDPNRAAEPPDPTYRSRIPGEDDDEEGAAA